MANMTTAAQTNSEDAKLVAQALISLVVATYGRGKELQPLMTSLAMQTDRRFEVIVVDQNADDRIDSVLEVARGSGLTVHHLHLDTPGLSSARNLGTALARGCIVAYPDDDCWYEPLTLARASRRLAGVSPPDGIAACLPHARARNVMLADLIERDAIGRQGAPVVAALGQRQLKIANRLEGASVFDERLSEFNIHVGIRGMARRRLRLQ